jgi:hypothetical protein
VLEANENGAFACFFRHKGCRPADNLLGDCVSGNNAYFQQRHAGCWLCNSDPTACLSHDSHENQKTD